MLEKDIAWLAGLLEGEGSFGHIKNCVLVQLSMSDKDIVERAGNLVGAGTITTRPAKLSHHKPMYSWCVAGEKAKVVMDAVLPYMGERRRQKIGTLLPLFEQRQVQHKSTLVCPHVDQYRKGRTVCGKCYQRAWYLKRKEG